MNFLLESKSIRLRLVEENDAEFILSLRLDPKYNNFISKVDNDIAAQKSWIRKYKTLEHDQSEFYFIIERLDGTPCGTVRVYDLIKNSFCWGSWILNKDKTRYSAVESALLVYEFGFKELGFDKCHFEVMKENYGVINFHEKFGANKVREDKDNFYFEITKKSVEKTQGKFMRLVK